MPSTYNVFLHNVFLRNLRTLLLVIGLVALGLGSWLETINTSTCSVETSMAMFEVAIFQNLSDHYSITPSAVTFGLWRQCFYFEQNCTCTTPSLRYQMDAQQAIFAATNNQTMPVLDPSQGTFLRSVPLILAMVLSFLVLLFGMASSLMHSPPSFQTASALSVTEKEVEDASWKQHPWISKCNGLVALISAALIALAFGASYQTYRNAIIDACTQVASQSVKCASLHTKTEVVLLPVALACLLIVSLLFACTKSRRPSEDSDIPGQSHRYTTRTTMTSLQDDANNKRRSTSSFFLSRHDEKIKSNATVDYHTDSSSMDDALDPWRQAGQYDDSIAAAFPLRPPPVNRLSSEDRRYQGSPHNRTSSSGRPNQRAASPGQHSRQRQSPHSHSTSRQAPRRHSHHLADDQYYHQQTSPPYRDARRASSPRMYDDDDDDDDDPLVPPRLPFAPKRQRRPNSHASGNTFGANEMLDSPVSSSSDTLDSPSPPSHRQYSDASHRRTPTPTQGSSHRHHSNHSNGYLSQHRTGSNTSLCFTPTANDRSRSSSHGSMTMNTKQQPRRPSHPLASSTATSSRSPSTSPVPTLQSPPAPRHPLNQKIIKDQRISSYFQQSQ
ncbi:hypothetical protein DM01DRAFT_1384224 [Hesseltinella vesiculosa]|uniref:Uncharacterized protein n=1 Tax=Hesseltinella vesiculosa TaxID=101127 RepID=A0A1X2GEH2_9FUNG|nr:hypothetical protein DM01DRAFT_1384224 [Hesseltinella vesiculosa]